MDDRKNLVFSKNCSFPGHIYLENCTGHAVFGKMSQTAFFPEMQFSTNETTNSLYPYPGHWDVHMIRFSEKFDNVSFSGLSLHAVLAKLYPLSAKNQRNLITGSGDN